MRSTTIVASIIAFSVAAVQAVAPEHSSASTAEHKSTSTTEHKATSTPEAGKSTCTLDCVMSVGKVVLHGHFTMTPGEYYHESQGLYCNSTDPKYSDFKDKLDVCLKKCPKEEQTLPKSACEGYSKDESGAHPVKDSKTTDAHSTHSTEATSTHDSKSHETTASTASKDSAKETHAASAAPILGVSTVLATLCGVVALFAL